VTSLA